LQASGTVALSSGAPLPGAASPLATRPASGANYSLFLLILTSACAQLDVAIVPYLAPYIQKAFRISDTALSLLVGVSFALFYTLVGIPIARFIDRYSRRKILAFGILTWTLGAVLCGFARNFAQLFAARFIVGGGEAVNGPTAYSVMGDLFKRERLPRAIALYHIGQVGGPALALLFSGLLMAAVIDMKPIQAPFGPIAGWQLVFILTGLPGFLIGALMLTTMREPQRRIIPNQMDMPLAHGAGGVIQDYVVAVRYMIAHRKVFAPIFLMLLVGALNFGAVAWMPIFYFRTFGWPPAKLAVFQSVMSLVVVPSGMILGVFLAERFTKAGHEDAPVRVLIIGRLLSLVGIFVPLMPSPWIALALGTFGSIALGMSGPIQNVQMQTVTPAELRGKITALYLFLLNVVGIALSPIIVAILTDYVFRDPMMVRWSISCLLAFSSPLALFFIVRSRKPFVAEVGRLKQLEAAGA
jgi:MFS family permease